MAGAAAGLRPAIKFWKVESGTVLYGTNQKGVCWINRKFPVGGVRAVRRSASTPPVLVLCTTSLSPRGTLFPAACVESITGLLSANTHALASALYYPHTSQLRSTRYILPHAVRHLPCPSSSRARALLKYRPYNFLLEDPAKPNLFSS